MSYKDIPLGSPEAFNVIIEIPKGSVNKYEYDEKLDAIKLDFVFTEGFSWIHNYGFIPQTLAEDGDQLDAFVITSAPIAVGTIVESRPIGILKMIDRGEQDDKILAVPLAPGPHERYQTIDDLTAEDKEALEKFLLFYAEVARQKEKTIKIIGFGGKAEAMSEIEKYRLDSTS